MGYNLSPIIEEKFHPLFRRLSYITHTNGGDMCYSYNGNDANISIHMRAYLRDFVLKSRLSLDTFDLDFEEFFYLMSDIVLAYQGTIPVEAKPYFKSELETFIEFTRDVSLGFKLIDFCPEWIIENFYVKGS